MIYAESSELFPKISSQPGDRCMSESKHLLSQFNVDDLRQEANNLVVALNLSLIDEATPFIDNQTRVICSPDLLDHLVEAEVHVDPNCSFELALECIRDIWDQVLKLEHARFENYRMIRHPECALIEAVSVNDHIGCAIQISVFPAQNVVEFPKSYRL